MDFFALFFQNSIISNLIEKFKIVSQTAPVYLSIVYCVAFAMLKNL